jgi:dTDP-glucose pyrophosphorylase/predicted transcriptional regulator
MIMYDWRKVILKLNDTIQTAIMALNEGSFFRIVMVVDESERLIGTVTDGDIRRGLIKHYSMDTEINKIMSVNPTVAFESDDKQKIFSKMKELDLLSIPIIDSDRKIVGIETLKNLLEKSKYDNPVFLMAGGFGKRLKPLTDHLPKPLLKVGNKPILENILDQFIASGFHDFYISTHYKAEMVKKHFGDGSNWNVSIKYIHEEEPLGTAGGLGLLPSDLPKLPILMMNGDLLTKIDFDKLLNFHLETGDDATMCVREYDFQVPYGVIKADGRHIVSIQEKPIQNFFVNAGVYVLNQSILDIVDGVNYLDMPELLEKIIKGSGRVNMFPVHEYWLDIGQIEQFDQAQQDSIKLFK